MRRLACAFVVTACHHATPAPPPAHHVAPPAQHVADDPSAWHCYVRAPGQPDQRNGNITHLRQRLVEGRLEVDSVRVSPGFARAVRLVFWPVGDRLVEGPRGTEMTAKLLAPDGSHWKLHEEVEMLELIVDEETTRDGDGETVVSTEITARDRVTTRVRYVTAPCATVEGELAKYP